MKDKPPKKPAGHPYHGIEITIGPGAKTEHLGRGVYRVTWPDAPTWPIPNWDEPEHAPEEES